jgi:4-amino-4-deoxy-L-arabinose transferase-like glycosyltransferase
MSPLSYWNKKILWILILGFILRVGVVIIARNELPISDPKDYDVIAMNISQGNGFHDEIGHWISRPPGYPFFLSIIYFIFGHHYWIVTLLQAIMGIGIVGLIYRITAEYFTESTALWAAGLVSFYPDFIIYCGYLYSETFYLFCLYGSLFFFFQSLKDTKNLSIPVVLAGIGLGMGALIRPVTLLLPFIFLLMQNIRLDTHAFDKNIIVKKITIIGFMLLTIFPWTLRNYLLGHTFVPVAAIDGINLWIGNNPWANGSYLLPPHNNLLNNTFLNEIQINHIAYKEGVYFILHSPLQCIHLGITKFVRTILPIPDSIFREFLRNIPIAKYILILFSIIFFELVLWGSSIWYYAKRHIESVQSYLLALLIYFAATHVIFFSVPRYKLPFLPVLIILGSTGLNTSLFNKTEISFSEINRIVRNPGLITTILLQATGAIYFYFFWIRK